jgi:hypothetical protein
MSFRPAVCAASSVQGSAFSAARASIAAWSSPSTWGACWGGVCPAVHLQLCFTAWLLEHAWQWAIHHWLLLSPAALALCSASAPCASGPPAGANPTPDDTCLLLPHATDGGAGCCAAVRHAGWEPGASCARTGASSCGQTRTTRSLTWATSGRSRSPAPRTPRALCWRRCEFVATRLMHRDCVRWAHGLELQ